MKEKHVLEKAIVVMSGGLDSTGVAAYWKQKGYELFLLTFEYGQRAEKEITAARELGKWLGAKEQRTVDISFMKELYGASNVLTDASQEMPNKFRSDIIVPIRNAVFLTIATAYAFSIGAKVVAYGAHLSDQPYPDCRPEFTKGLADVLNLADIDAISSGAHPRVNLWSPAIEGLSKDAMLKISFGILKEQVYLTWSCYLDGEKQCGRCESCNNRKRAFELAGIRDLTAYAF